MRMPCGEPLQSDGQKTAVPPVLTIGSYPPKESFTRSIQIRTFASPRTKGHASDAVVTIILDFVNYCYHNKADERAHSLGRSKAASQP